jgi:hypothetical protein
MQRSCALGAFIILVFPAFSQDAPSVRTGNTEVGGFVGTSHGVDNWRVMGGGNIVYALTRNLMPYGEYSYFPGITRRSTISLGGSQTARYTFSVPISDFHGGVHLRFPIPSSRVVPYVAAAVGGLRSSGRSESISLASGTIPIVVPSETSFAANFGGGLRVYATEQLGFRVEAKVYKPTGTYTDPFYKVTAGFFFIIR